MIIPMRARDPKKEKSIRDRAMAMIVKEGLDGLSMQKLAKAAGVSPATIYIYYKDRDDLIIRLYEEAFRKMSECTLENFHAGMSFAEGLKVQWFNRARHCLQHPVEADFMEQVRFSPLYEKVMETGDQSFMKTMRAFVKGAIERKEIIRVPVEVYWSVAFAPMYQLIKFHRHGKGMPGTGKFILDEKTLMLALDLVLKALKP